ncbi:hypothetical protein EB231_11170 [Mesorhizobium sp. NZP2298]|nr:hypothetical protein EB231_11170 [Mesorhizobium sp. NZP2298]
MVQPKQFAAKVPIPKRLMHILEGEALLNDASGLVCMRFEQDQFRQGYVVLHWPGQRLRRLNHYRGSHENSRTIFHRRSQTQIPHSARPFAPFGDSEWKPRGGEDYSSIDES